MTEQDSKFLNWIADRFVNVHGESENVDFVLKLRELARLPESEKKEATFTPDTLGNTSVIQPDGTVVIEKKELKNATYEQSEEDQEWMNAPMGKPKQPTPAAEECEICHSKEHDTLKCPMATVYRTPAEGIVWPERKLHDHCLYAERPGGYCNCGANSWNACHNAFMAIIKQRGL